MRPRREALADMLREMAEAERAGQRARWNHLARRLERELVVVDATNPEESAELRQAQMWAGLSRARMPMRERRR